MNPYQILELILEALADGRQEGESITDYKKRKADELEKHFANKEEEAKAKARAYNHQYKKEKKEWKNNPQMGAEKALDTADKALNNIIKSSDARRKKWEVQGIKKKMNKNEALELMEAIINEVSVKRWKEAAANSLDKRKEAADTTAKNAEQTWDDYDRISRKHPEDEPQLYRLAQANDEVAGKAEDSADHAYAVTRLRTHDKANANKAIKAARKVADKRDDEFNKKLDKRTFLRMGKADQLVSADPVKSRTDEAFSLMEQIVDFADNLFELDLEQKQNISPNKVSRVKKDKNGEKVEVVSVADELFPYEGDAKQQFNQKVLAKINDMIEGTGSLEDLIQFVRKGVAMKKQNAHEGLNEEKNIFGKETGRGDLLNDVDDALGSPVKKKLADIKAKMTGCKETKVHEALDLMGEIINEVSLEWQTK